MVSDATRRVKFHFDNVHFHKPLELGRFTLAQAGDLAADSGYVCPLHTQTVYEMSYVVSGKGVFCVNGMNYNLEKGTFFINHPSDTHVIMSDHNDPIRYFYLGFGFINEALDEPEYQLLQSFFDRAESRVGIDDGHIQSAFLILFDQLLTDDVFKLSMLSACVHQIVVSAYRCCTDISYRRAYSPQSLEGKKRLLYDVIHFLDMQCDDINALKKLGPAFGYSYSYLSELFTGSMNQSLREYYVSRRFERAVRLLASGMSVTQTAGMLGYSSIHSFSRAFPRAVGMTPRDCGKSAEIYKISGRSNDI